MAGSPAARTPPGVRPLGAAELPPRGLRRSPDVRWGPALAYALAVVVVGSIAWGALFALGYISLLVSIVLGYAMSWALAKGAGTVTVPLILLAIALTLLMVFLGGIVAIMIAIGVGPADALALYPVLVEVAAGDVALGFIFGLVGAGFGAYSLWKQRSSRAAYLGGPPPYVPIGPTASAPGVAPPTQVPSVQRGAYDVTMEFTVPSSPPHRVRAYYTTMSGRTEVFLDGRQVAKTRVWGMKREVNVPLPDSGRRVQVLFRGAVAPAIDILLDGTVIAST